MSNGNFDYKLVCGSESWGSDGAFGIKIMVASSKDLPDLESEAIQSVAFNAVRQLKTEIMTAIAEADPATAEKQKRERRALTDLFPAPIYVETIPNEYTQEWYGRIQPWFSVTTEIGRFKIGWRKRVIHLEWTETLCQTSAEDLFPGEDSTKYDRVIHAWTLERAGEYIARIIQAGKEAQK